MKTVLVKLTNESLAFTTDPKGVRTLAHGMITMIVCSNIDCNVIDGGGINVVAVGVDGETIDILYRGNYTVFREVEK